MIAWLLTWLWQGLALVVSVSLAVRLARRIDAGTRYVFWWASLIVLLWLGWAAAFDAAPKVGPAVPSAEAAATATSPALVMLPALPVIAVLALGAAWLLAAAIGLTRLCKVFCRLLRLKGSCEPLSRTRENRLLLWSRERGRGRRARLMVSDALLGPAVLGLIRPCIAVPRHLAERLSDRDLDHVVLHELAHVRRWDDWARLLQSVVEIAAGFHPAVWWAGRRLSLEREVACDEWVVARSGAPRVYAHCLSRVAALQAGRARATLLPAFVGRRGELVRRVDRLMETAFGLRRPRSRWLMTVGALALAVLAVELRGLPPLVAERAAEIVRAAPPGSPRDLAMAPGLDPRPAPAELPPVVAAPLAANPIGAMGVGRPAASGSGDRIELVAGGPLPVVSRSLIASTQIVATGRLVTLDPPPAQPDDIREPITAGEGPRWAVAGSVGVTIGTTMRVAGVATAGAFTSVGRSVGRWFYASAQ